MKQESLFGWKMGTVQNCSSFVIKVPQKSTVVQSNLKAEPCIWKDNIWGDHNAAFMVAELGEVLPGRVERDGKYYMLIAEKHVRWQVKYVTYRNGVGFILGGYAAAMVADTEARAMMLIYLIANQLVDTIVSEA